MNFPHQPTEATVEIIFICAGSLLQLPLTKCHHPNLLHTNIQWHCLLEKKENIFHPSLHSCSGQIGGSAEDLLRDVDSWAHSAGRWVSDTRMRLWNGTRVIPGHLHTASIPIGTSHPPSLPLLPPVTPSLSVFVFHFLFSLPKSLHLPRTAPDTR